MQKRPYKLVLPKKHSYMTTYDVLKTFSEKTGEPLELITDMYYHYVETLREKAKSTEVFAYRLSSFGNIFLSAPGLSSRERKTKRHLGKPSLNQLITRRFIGRKKEIVQKLIKESVVAKKYNGQLYKKARDIRTILNE